MQMIPIVFQASLLTLQMAVAALTAVASLMVAVAEDLVPLIAVKRRLESTDFSLSFALKEESSLKKVPIFAIIGQIEKLRRDPM